MNGKYTVATDPQGQTSITVDAVVNAPVPFERENTLWGAGWGLGYQANKSESYMVLWEYNDKLEENTFQHYSLQIDETPDAVVSSLGSSVKSKEDKPPVWIPISN